MMSPFDVLRSTPTRWNQLFRHHPHGAHWNHAVKNLTALAVVTINDALIDSVDIRRHPRLALSQVKGDRCVLTISITKRRKHIPITLREKSIYLGDDLIRLDNPDGPLHLVTALVHEIENFWNSGGR
jgi:hypothetical protein